MFCHRLFSHPMPLGIGYFFYGFVHVIGYEALGIWFYLFLSYPMSLGIQELACRQGTGFGSMVDEGRSG